MTAEEAAAYLKLDQSTPQTLSGGAFAGSGLLKITSGLLGVDTNIYALNSALSSYVPYTGASSTLNLGSQNFLTTGTLGAGAITGTSLSLTADTAQLVFDSDAGSGVTTTLQDSAATSGKTITLPNFTGTLYISGGTDVAVADGGTNISSYAVGDLLYASGTTTLSKLADVSSGSYLRSGGITTAPLWSTLKLPNAASIGTVIYATEADTLGSSSYFSYDSSDDTLYTPRLGIGVLQAAFVVNSNTIGGSSGIGLVGETWIVTDEAPFDPCFGIYASAKISAHVNGDTTAFGAGVDGDAEGLTTYAGYFNNEATNSSTQYGIYVIGDNNYFSDKVGIGMPLPTAVLHLKAGTATINTSPLKFTSGTDLTTAEAGAFEYDGTLLHFTRTGTQRENVCTVVTKETTGDGTGAEGLMQINTYDNTLKVYAEGAWRQIASW